MAPEGQGAVVMTLEPVWVAILSALLMGEQLNHFAVLGMAIIFLALIVNGLGTLRMAKRSKRARETAVSALSQD